MAEEIPSENPAGWIGFSLKSLLVILAGIVWFVWYIRIVLFGDNSLTVLNRLQQTRARLLEQSRSLKRTNQRLQKKYFELIQLNSSD